MVVLLLYMLIKQKERKRERKKERKNEIQQLVTGIVPLKGHLCTLFTPKSFMVVH